MIPILLVALIPSYTWLQPAEPPADAAMLDSFAKRCSGVESADCLRQRARLERELYFVLREVKASGEELGAEVWRAALAARDPRLKALALDHLAREGVGPADEPLVLEAAESPFPGVRDAALGLVSRLSTPAARLGERHHGASRGLDPAQQLLEADAAPQAKDLGVGFYPGARYSFLASTSERALFVSHDPLDKVVAFYAKGGKRVLSAAAVTVRAEPTQQDAMRIAQEMQAAIMRGEDPQAAMARLTQTMGGAGTNWTEGIEGVEGVSDARYVAVEETTLGGKRMPSRVVAVYRDEILGGTVIALHRVPDTAAVMRATSDPERMERHQRIMQLMMMPTGEE
jgi:hypothetical protein